MDNALKESQLCLSAINEIELLCWKSPDPEDFKVLKNFINDSVIIELEKPIKTKTAEFRNQYNIKLPDAIIAASAVYYDLTLITRNVKDFSQVSELKWINPFDL